VALAHQRLRRRDGGGIGGDIRQHRGRRGGRAPSPAAAVAAGREARLTRYPVEAARQRRSLFERAERVGEEDGGGWILYCIAGLTLLLLTASSLAFADVPKPQDIAACNEEAREATRRGKDSRGASPTADDHRRAADARRKTPADTGGSARTENPQLEGMDPERAGDPVYHAAYRACMRKAGF
jgi:hypothetical protein